MKSLFSGSLKHRKRARTLAICWTLLIFFLCLTPGKDIPKVDVPLIDKWVHFLLFAVFSFLWLLSFSSTGIARLLLILACSISIGWLVEELQGVLTFLGRSKETIDILADSIGGLLGVVIFAVAAKRKSRTDNS